MRKYTISSFLGGGLLCCVVAGFSWLVVSFYVASRKKREPRGRFEEL